MKVISPVAKLIDSLQRFPGIGPRSAERLAYFILRMPDYEVTALITALQELKEQTKTCARCFNLSTEELCVVCQDVSRNQNILLVVEDPLDVMAIERTDKFNGTYHVLGGVIDPIKGIGPDELRVKELLDRVRELVLHASEPEVILATNPSTEGETTAIYLRKVITEQIENPIRITRIARGLPVGGDLEYADPVTLSRSLEGRMDYR